MKLNLDTTLPDGLAYQFTEEQRHKAPEHIRELLSIEGIRSVYQVKDFIAVSRHAKWDWRSILPQVARIFGDQSLDVEAMVQSITSEEDSELTGAQVFIQTVKGIPMQIKLVTSSQEKRYPLPKRFLDAAQKVQPTIDNLLTSRRWEEHGMRYGPLDEIGAQVAEEINAVYDQERLDQLVQNALEGKEDVKHTFTSEEVNQFLSNADWKKRFAALEQLKLTEDDIPILQKALDDPQVSIRRLSAAYLGEIGSKAGIDKVLPLLIKALKDNSPIVRRTAGDALSDLGDIRAQDAMIDALHDEHKIVRWRAARFLYEVGDERAVPALRRALYDPEFEISLQAKLALERIEKGGEAQGTVWQQIARQTQKPDQQKD
jgi:hypothetical protein